MAGIRTTRKFPVAVRMKYRKVGTDEESEELHVNEGASATASILTLAKGTLGVGMLALPYKIYIGGIPIFVVFLLITAFFTIKSVEMIGRGSALTKRYVFEDIVNEGVGPAAAFVLAISMIVNCLGSSVGYVIAIRQANTALFAQFGSLFRVDIGTSVTIAFTGLLCFVSLYDKLTELAWMSYTGLAGVGAIIAAIVYSLVCEGVANNLSNPELISTVDTILHSNGGYLDLVGVVSTITFALCNQYGVPQVLSDLKDKSERNVQTVAVWASLIPVLVYLLSGICGYLCFGVNIESNILKNFEPMISRGNWAIICGVAAVVLSVGSSFVINNFALKLSSIYLISRISESWRDHPLVTIVLPLFLSGGTVVCGMLFPSFSVVLDFVGSATGSIICYIMPALISLAVKQGKSPRRVGWDWFWHSLKTGTLEWVMLAIGIFLGCGGTLAQTAQLRRDSGNRAQEASIVRQIFSDDPSMEMLTRT